MQGYKHLKSEDRENIFLLQRSGKTQKEIAHILGKHKSTISRELKRGITGGDWPYRPSIAHKRAQKRASNSRKIAYVWKVKGLRQLIDNKLLLDWSPEQITGWLKRQDNGLYLNHESIYQYIYSRPGVLKRLGYHLRRKRLFRRLKGSRRPKPRSIVDRIDIAQRPMAINDRAEFGHWEADSMLFLGQKQSLATQVERKSRYIIAEPMKNRMAQTRASYISDTLKQWPQGTAKSLTCDNGTEFAGHKVITEQTGANVYFAQPYKAWQKGSIENANGLIRWYLPRMTDINKLQRWKMQGIIALINSRPRKCLDFRTPLEVFTEEVSKLP